MEDILAHSPELKAKLQAFIKHKATEIESQDKWGKDFLKRFEPYASSGKLIRGSLVCRLYEMFSHKPPNDPVLKAAMAVELTHSGLLIHDDIMDQDSLRRGQPAMHSQYQSLGQANGLSDSDHFGISLAICGGDTALFLAFELLAELEDQPGRAARQLFLSQLSKVCAGQMQDIYLEAKPGMPDKQAIYWLMRNKTASYTLALPMVMGATLANQPDATLKLLQEIGVNAGTIFQIRDDQLGVIAQSSATGKPTGSDIKEGKKTLVYYFLFNNCTAAERRKLQTIFGNPKLKPSDITYILELYKKYKIGELIAGEIKSLQTNCDELIDQLQLKPDYRRELKQLVDFCAKRST